MTTPPVKSIPKSSDTSPYFPKGTVRCSGVPTFRSQMARDFGCILDVDKNVRSWSCLTTELVRGDLKHIPDFTAEGHYGPTLFDVVPAGGAANAWVVEAASEAGVHYQTVHPEKVYVGFTLKNACDLLRYANWTCPLGDRLRLLTALEEQGSLTISESLSAFQETLAVAGLASLVLNRFIDIELDNAPIAPDTIVTLWRD
ncbi:hypothetical protein J2X72_001371 [Phyllobacterium sp. 1468]|uniref:hypothetical protein n=1 Tax=Phyllobacterium sp. 1468 TaxID=2817759 RepID=UPI00285F52D0|nr:hypothetical protein [Phyllobacterium sp. 1468]MDR6632587.1 hypothetical protein [Phyllobacterium sp. 1468]